MSKSQPIRLGTIYWDRHIKYSNGVRIKLTSTYNILYVLVFFKKNNTYVIGINFSQEPAPKVL